MYLHLGKDIIVSKKDILFILDMDTSTYSNRTKSFLRRAEKEKKVISVSLLDLPKSIVAAREGDKTLVYLSPLAPKTLLKRATEYEIL